MQSFTVHTGTVAVLDRDSVDTDQIIPKQFLKRTERTGYSDCLFFDWRYDGAGKPNPAFPLNAAKYKGASILVAGKNFGCGSSREHAVWALRDYGFRAVIAPSFADIFANNCVKNGLLAVTLNPADIATLKSRDAAGRLELTVDLRRCEVWSGDGFRVPFAVDPFRRTCLLEGLDEIGMTFTHEAEITAYEKQRSGGRTAP
ncbi:MAG TPA: 3-isopropylmalate dehydratase small subunit [Candidatus Angelobacter sp.]